jgi:IS5 family transposase
VYRAATCGDCHLRASCTKAAQERRIKRRPEDAQRAARRLVMQHPQARRIFGQRKTIVEPVFSNLRSQQGLNRFRCSGLQAVRREFALHVLAHNLPRAVALSKAYLPFCMRLYVASARSPTAF